MNVFFAILGMFGEGKSKKEIMQELLEDGFSKNFAKPAIEAAQAMISGDEARAEKYKKKTLEAIRKSKNTGGKP